jgi:hypothetical protein
MPLPSDPDYTPAATNPNVLACHQYQELLRMNIDPYAPHSRNEGLIQYIEEYVSADTGA